MRTKTKRRPPAGCKKAPKKQHAMCLNNRLTALRMDTYATPARISRFDAFTHLRARVQPEVQKLPLRADMGQHHVAGADVLAGEFSDVDVVCNQDQRVVAFAW